MKRAGGLCIAIFGATGLFAQGHAGSPAGHSGPGVTSRPGRGMIPGGQNPPNITYPASSTPRPASPAYGRRNSGVITPIYVPVYGGGYGYGYGDGSYGAPYPPADSSYQPGYPPNVNMMYYPPPAYPPEVAQSRTVVNPYAPPDADSEGPPTLQPDNSAAQHYLIALKDHTIAAAVAYYVEGDTLHYFTDGNVHNQVSISAVDRDLTDRLNKESGKQVVLTPVKQ